MSSYYDKKFHIKIKKKINKIKKTLYDLKLIIIFFYKNRYKIVFIYFIFIYYLFFLNRMIQILMEVNGL